jgi:preprotein translocase SecE subunit
MAQVIKHNDGKDAMDDQEERSPQSKPSGEPEPEDRRAPAPQPRQPELRKTAETPRRGAGFFTIYKHGQGYWTRMGTAGGAALIGLMTASFVYENVVSGVASASVRWAIVAGFLAVYAIFAFWLMNKPGNADFLIATDSEMKKVNWTDKNALVGSTKVVILFMLLIAGILFIVDVFFGYLFKFMHVLKLGPFG